MLNISTRMLDHLVYLVPTGALDEGIQHFRKLGFNVIPGGTHADGLTVNALIVLQDHVYIELISFTPTADPNKRKSHRWGQLEPGWIDFANLGPGALGGDVADTINQRSKEEHTDVSYLSAVPGGRTRPDGKKLRWEINAPDPKHGVGKLPFFCGDITPRLLRAPVVPITNTQHPNGAEGIVFVHVLCSTEEFSPLLRQFETVLGVGPTSHENDNVHATSASSDSDVGFILTTPNVLAPKLKLFLSTPRNEEEAEEAKKGARIHAVGLHAKANGGAQCMNISVRNGKAAIVRLADL